MIKGLKNVFLFVKHIIRFFVFFISFLSVRNKKIWLYGNYGGKFRDNSKYFFLYSSQHLPDIRHIWISPYKDDLNRIRSLGFKATYKYSLKAIYYALVAKVYIYNMYGTTDIFNGCFRGNAFFFNFWHGVPFKKIEYDINTGPLQVYHNPKNFTEKIKGFLIDPPIFRRSSAVLATSEKLVPIFASSFQFTTDKIFVGPYPRNEVFKLSKQELIERNSKIESVELNEAIQTFEKFEKVIIYMPTWRDAYKEFIHHAIPDFDALQTLCKTHNILFIIKAHIFTEFNVDISQYSHIKRLDNNCDVYPLLPFTHALISDYSSIIFDYSLLKKKMIFYAFDKEEYLSKSRESYFKYEEAFTDKITNTFEKLLAEIEEVALEDSTAEHIYQKPFSFLQNDKKSIDIADYIKKAINYPGLN